MFEAELAINRFLIQYGRMMVADLSDERMADQPLPGLNHPAWILGHLAYSADGAVGVLGGDKMLTAEWVSRFGPGSQPTAIRSDYPSKEDLLREFEGRFEKARELAAAAHPDRLGRRNPHPRLRGGLPTVRDLVALLLTGHLGVHLGQLSMWRRAIGLSPMF